MLKGKVDMHNIELITDARCIVGESPLWDDRNDRLLMVDIQGKRMRIISWGDGSINEVVLPQQAGFLVLGSKGEILAGAEDGVYEIIGSEMRAVSKPTPLKGARFNDGRVGPDGMLYLGTFSRDYSAAFYRMDPHGNLTELFDGVGNSNGLDWDVNLGKFYYNDTPLGRTDSFDFGTDGTLTNRCEFFRYVGGGPDGMTIDSNGNLWTAVWGSGSVVCINSRTGKMVDKIDLPVSQPSSCTFAGADLKTLVITSAAHNIHLKDEPLAGATFAVRPGVQGITSNRIRLEV